MNLQKFGLIALVSLGIATTGLFATTHFPAVSEPLLSQPKSTDWQMPMRQRWMRGNSQHGPMMMQMQVSSEFEYLSQMIPHHEEAIATAQRVLEQSDRPEMREFAQTIIDVQSAEIEQMQNWLKAWYPGEKSSATYTPMMRDLSQLKGNDLDQAFLEDMIMHHMGAVMMSHMLIRHGLVEHDAVQPFAQNIADTQRQEIGQMQAWLQNWYGVTGMPCRMNRGQRAEV